jgi:hypothetical protein
MKTTSNKTSKRSHKHTYSSAFARTSVLTYVNPGSLAVALFITLALLGTAGGNATGMTKSVHAQPGELSRGALEVYSATDEFNDGDTLCYAHSAYAIYTLKGKLFKNVENHISRSDEIPEVVALPAGSYLVEARSEKDGYVRVPVVIKAGQRTIVDLDIAEQKT